MGFDVLMVVYLSTTDLVIETSQIIRLCLLVISLTMVFHVMIELFFLFFVLLVRTIEYGY